MKFTVELEDNAYDCLQEMLGSEVTIADYAAACLRQVVLFLAVQGGGCG